MQNEKLRTIQSELQSSRDMYSHLYDFSPVGYFSIGEKGMIEKVNLTGAAMMGIERGRLIGKHFPRFIHGDDQDRWYSYQQRLNKTTGESISFSLRMLKEEGHEFYAQMECAVFRESNGDLMEIRAAISDITDRKRAEEDIRKARREWENIFQAVGHATLIIDKEHRVLHANEATEKATGIPEKDLIGKKCHEIFHRTDQPPEGCPFEKVMASGHLETVEMEIQALEGAFLVSCTPMLDESGRIEKIIHIATDITERKKAEDALRGSEIWLQNIFNALEEAVLVVSPDKIILKINHSTTKILGYSQEEVAGLSPELFHVDHEHFVDFVNRINEAFNRGQSLHAEFMLKRKSGEVFPTEHTVTLMKDSQGTPLGIVNVFRDISERKHAEEALKKAQRLLTETEKIGKVGGWEFNIDTEKQTWTEEVYRIHELDLTYEPTMRKGIDFYTPASRPIIEQAVQRAINHGEPFDLELEIITAKGNLRSVHAIGKTDLKHHRVYGFFQDITEKRRLQAQLMKSQKAESIATLAGGIAHDYNNLLAVIMGNVSIAQEETEPYSAMAGFLHEIEQASCKARDLTYQFLTLSKGGYPRKELGSIKNLLEEIRGQFQAHEASTTFAIQDDLWSVGYDSKQMHFAISNVLKNAVEATPQGGAITIQAENQVIENKDKDATLPLNEGKYVRISIKDEGRGIPEEDMTRIFDPYFSTKERGVQKGMGLGLTTAYAVVEKHDGHIMVNSTTAVGTTVTIYLPAMGIAERGMRNAERGPVQAERESEQSTIGNQQSTIQSILVMDDEEMLRDLGQKMLERLGYKVETVKDGVEAIETYKKHMNSGEPFDAVILDLTIKGGMGGDQAIKELIKIDPDVKAIVCSGYFNDPVLANYEEHGFRGAMAKPYQKADLESVLKKVLG